MKDNASVACRVGGTPLPDWGKAGKDAGRVAFIDSQRQRQGGVGWREGVGGLPIRNMLDKTMPLVHPVIAMTAAALFVPMRTGDDQITGLLPAEGAPSIPSTPLG
jgi:hypothetical protein